MARGHFSIICFHLHIRWDMMMIFIWAYYDNRKINEIYMTISKARYFYSFYDTSWCISRHASWWQLFWFLAVKSIRTQVMIAIIWCFIYITIICTYRVTRFHFASPLLRWWFRYFLRQAIIFDITQALRAYYSCSAIIYILSYSRSASLTILKYRMPRCSMRRQIRRRSPHNAGHKKMTILTYTLMDTWVDADLTL